MIWKCFLHYWPFVRGIHLPQVDSLHKRSVMSSFDVFFTFSLNKQLNKWLNCQCFEMPWHSCDVTLITPKMWIWYLRSNEISLMFNSFSKEAKGFPQGPRLGHIIVLMYHPGAPYISPWPGGKICHHTCLTRITHMVHNGGVINKLTLQAKLDLCFVSCHGT